MVNKDSQ